jgi:hypothetical protein
MLAGQDDETEDRRTGADLQRFTDEDEAVPCADGLEVRAVQWLDTGYVRDSPLRREAARASRA